MSESLDAKPARSRALFPRVPISDILELARAILKHAPTGKIRRLTLFDQLKKSPDSGPSRMLITTSAAYGLTKGSYGADHIELTELGTKAANDSDPATQKAALISAVMSNQIFKGFFDKHKNLSLPAEQVARDALGDLGVPEADRGVCWQVIKANGEFTGLIQQKAQGLRVLPTEQVLEEIGPGIPPSGKPPTPTPPTQHPGPSPRDANVTGTGPSLHVDLQIHIPESATAEQIELIMKAIGKHLYGRDA